MGEDWGLGGGGEAEWGRGGRGEGSPKCPWGAALAVVFMWSVNWRES